jgi:tripartite ATP-independent transporter DctP family solute receptor
MATAADMPKMTMTVSHTGSDESMNQFVSLKIKELLESRSNGNITVEIYPAGQLGADKDMILSTKNGDIDFHVCSTGPLVNDIPAASIIDIPFLFNDVQSARKTLNDPYFRKMFESEFEKSGFKLLIVTDQGFRTLTTNKKIEKINDLKGISIRIMENKNHLAFWKDLGVNATPLNFGEVYMSLQQGLLNGQENPYNIIYDSKFYEVQKYVTNINHIYHCMTVAMGISKYNELPEIYKTLVKDVMMDVTNISYEQSNRSSNEYLKKLLDGGMTFIDFDKIPNAREELRKRTYGATDRVRETIKNDALVDAFLKASAK